jgi:hypothetical protein
MDIGEEKIQWNQKEVIRMNSRDHGKNRICQMARSNGKPLNLNTHVTELRSKRVSRQILAVQIEDGTRI